jgi:hypothetical protein
MNAVYPTTPVQDGMPSQDLNIPRCISKRNGVYYCYDTNGNLVYVTTSPPGIIGDVYPNIEDTWVYASHVSAVKDYSSLTLMAGNGSVIINSASFNFSNSANIGFSLQNGAMTFNRTSGRPFFGFLQYSGSVSVPVGTSNTYGSTETVYSAPSINNGYVTTLPVYITVTWGGTFASGETVTVQLTFNIYTSGSYTTAPSLAFSPSTTLSATSTGSQSLNINNIIAVITPAITTANQLYFVQSVTAAAASSASSTSVTVSVQAWFLTS